MELEQYLRENLNQHLVNPKHRVEYVQSLEEVDMTLHWVQNEHHPKGKWRVAGWDGQLCCYFRESFEEALKALQTSPTLLKKKLYNNYGK